jgi:UrcA family protein
MRLSTVALACAAFIVSTTTLAVEPKGDTVQMRISPDEADTAEGAQALHERIKAFAHSECDQIDDTNARNPNAERCVRNLVTQFVEAIDKPLLDAAASEATVLTESDPS